MLVMERNESTTILFFTRFGCHNHNYFFLRIPESRSTENKGIHHFNIQQIFVDLFLHSSHCPKSWNEHFCWAVPPSFRPSTPFGHQLPWQPVEVTWGSSLPFLNLVSHILTFSLFLLLSPQSLGYNPVTDCPLAGGFRMHTYLRNTQIWRKKSYSEEKNQSVCDLGTRVFSLSDLTAWTTSPLWAGQRHSEAGWYWGWSEGCEEELATLTSQTVVK